MGFCLLCMIFFFGSCRRSHGTPVNRTPDEGNLNETRLLLAQGQKKPKHSLSISQHMLLLIFHPSKLSDLFLLHGNALCRNVLTPLLIITPSFPPHFSCLYSPLRREGVSISCAHTPANLYHDYFSCLTQIAYDVRALCGCAQQLCL